MQAPQTGAGHSPAVTILKPLHQGEPDLSRNLETFFAQDYDGQVQIVFGVHDESDPAVRGGAGAAGQISASATPRSWPTPRSMAPMPRSPT